jgi:hypothetical protein
MDRPPHNFATIGDADWSRFLSEARAKGRDEGNEMLVKIRAAVAKLTPESGDMRSCSDLAETRPLKAMPRPTLGASIFLASGSPLGCAKAVGAATTSEGATSQPAAAGTI